MDEVLYKRVKDVVARALELKGHARDQYLTEECRGNPELQREVERLLEQDRTSCERFLKRPLEPRPTELREQAGDSPAAPPDKLPDRVGPFRVRKLLGHGGMGAVYLCEQDKPVRREVAVKVIRADLTAPHAAARFDVERQALASLAHPNIAQIYQAGTTDEGYPYLAMEHCSGSKVTELCDRRRLPLEERLKLFISICEAVQHAHRRGIIHRDLKPSNIMVTEIDGRPSVKVIDFGIAKVFDQSETLDLTGQRIIGTPPYMSPEALGLVSGVDVDTRSDVYSLGIVLYELLVGMRPHPFDALASFLTRMANESTPRPSERLSSADQSTKDKVAETRGLGAGDLQRRLQGDLDWIVATAVSWNREERYGSAAELAADVQRYLDHQPVMASPPTLRYRVGKLVRRHRALTALGTVAALAIVGGTIGTSLGMVQARAEAERANNEAQTAQRALEETRQVSDFLIGLFQVSNPWRTEEKDLTVRELLERGSEKLKTELADQPLARARFLQTIGDVYTGLGDYGTAEAFHRDALALIEEGAPHSEVGLAKSLLSVGQDLLRQSRYSEVEPLLARALEIYERTRGPEAQETANVLSTIASLKKRFGHFKEAEEIERRVVAISEAAYGSEHKETGRALYNLGLTVYRQARFDEARDLTQRAATAFEASRANPLNLATAHNLLCIIAKGQGHLDEAVGQCRAALAIWEERVGPDNPEVANTLNNLGSILNMTGDRKAAEAAMRRALDIRIRLFGEDNDFVASSLTNLGALYLDEGRLDEAAEMITHSREIGEQTLGPDHPTLAIADHNLGLIALAQQNLPEARRLFERALRIRTAALGSDHTKVGYDHHGLAEVLLRQGRLEEAAHHLEKALAIYRAKITNEHPRYRDALDLRTRLREASGEPAATENGLAGPGLP